MALVVVAAQALPQTVPHLAGRLARRIGRIVGPRDPPGLAAGPARQLGRLGPGIGILRQPPCGHEGEISEREQHGTSVTPVRRYRLEESAGDHDSSIGDAGAVGAEEHGIEVDLRDVHRRHDQPEEAEE